MQSVSVSGARNITLGSPLSGYLQHLVNLARPYDTIILLYEDDFSDQVLAAWAELDRLNIKTRTIGELNGIEVHTFGMDEFPPGAAIVLNIREASQDNGRRDLSRAVYRSLLNELSLISVHIRPPSQNDSLKSW